MGSRDPRIDAYIAKAAPFARPILAHLREQVHAACPEVEETIKWSAPHFLHRGKLLCGMAAFKQHCAFGFWKEAAIPATGKESEAMGQFGRIARREDLPDEATLASLIGKAIQAREAPAPAKRAARKAVQYTMPPALAEALEAHPKAKAVFDGFSPSHRRDYAEWIAEAKAEATRERRLAQAIEWLSEGKTRHWKYQNCK